ncbi:MAG: tyrosine--tRNA ligase [Thermoflexales bacterium]|nr:tyrosine--tRNA ligase [Thermoflexales bacterium]
MATMTIDEQVALLMQGTDYGDPQIAATMARELRVRLEESARTGKPLKVYCGYDPRTSDLHIGHTITMRKLRQFQELGHDVTFLIGTYTSLLGDPSDKDKLRPQLTSEQVAANSRTYSEQAFKILDRSRTQVRFNAEWLSELSFLDVIKLAENFTLQQFLTRENFAQRLEKGDPIYLHETFYALMQGYDAVAQDTDVQVGGTDQFFNVLTAGRKLQQAAGKRPQIGVFVKILPGTDGVIKMSKSLGNHIPILSTPEDMYGKVMSVPDAAMPLYFELATRYTPPMLADVLKRIADPANNPRDLKMELAREIVTIFHDADAAARAERDFITRFREREVPENIPDVTVTGSLNIVDVIAEAKLAKSKGEARRLIEGGGVTVDGRKVADWKETLDLAQPVVLKVGKRQYARVHKG